MAERLSLEVREEIEVGPYGVFDAYAVADLYGIPVGPLSSLAEQSGVAWPLEDPEQVSAVTVFAGSRRMMLVNDDLSVVRQRSAIAHELAHVLLEHEPGPAVESGERIWEPVAEREADWLAGCLLIPKSAAIGCAIAGMPDEAVARRYGTSRPLARWRLNATGARVIARRSVASEDRGIYRTGSPCPTAPRRPPSQPTVGGRARTFYDLADIRVRIAGEGSTGQGCPTSVQVEADLLGRHPVPKYHSCAGAVIPGNQNRGHGSRLDDPSMSYPRPARYSPLGAARRACRAARNRALAGLPAAPARADVGGPRSAWLAW